MSKRPKILNDIRDIDARYLAGFFDGEGSILILPMYKKRKTGGETFWYLRLCITNTHQGVMEWIQSIFGGCLNNHPGNKRGNSHVWFWQAYSQEAKHILKAMLPYFRVKRNQAELAVQFQEMIESKSTTLVMSEFRKGKAKGNLILTDDDFRVRREMAQQLKDMRKKDKQVIVADR